MITIFNRRELIVTFDDKLQAEVRKVLAKYNIDYIINPIQMTFNINRCMAEYKIYVHKNDYELARKILGQVLS